LPAEHTDSELLSACLAHHGWAWDALVDRYKGLVYSIALRTGLSQDDAADVFQTVFGLLLQHLPTIREPQGLAAWFITTTKRECWRLLRKRQREVTGSELPALFAAAEGWLHNLAAEESLWVRRALIGDALALIGERCRKLLSLLYLEPEEPSYDEISARLAMPLGSIGPTRARCLRKMRELLARMGMDAV